MATPDPIIWFRQANRYASQQGFAAGMPSFDRAKQGDRTVDGVYLFNSSAVVWRDVNWRDLFPRRFLWPTSEGKPGTFQDWFRAVNRYADRQGFAAAFPTFESADYGNGTVYGVFLFKPNMTDWRDVRKGDLRPFDAADPAAWFRAANHWAYDHGRPCGFPTYETAVYPAPMGQVFGVTAITGAEVLFRDVDETVLFPPAPQPPRPSTGTTLAGLVRPNPGGNVFHYEGSSLALNPAGRITRVTSNAINTGGRGMELDFSYRDDSGRTRDSVRISTGAPAHQFDGLFAQGLWRAEAVNISAALLPQSLTLTLEWAV